MDIKKGGDPDEIDKGFVWSTMTAVIQGIWLKPVTEQVVEGDT